MPKLPIRLPQLTQWLIKHFGLLLVTLFLIVVTVINWPKPGEWLMGWDNFSVTPDLWLNLKRTLFATWREYRGFGVASDSEVVDLFRQLPLFLLQAIIPNYLLEWHYYFGMYWLGTLGAYALTSALLAQLAPPATKKWYWSLLGVAGALFYATNLYSLEVFYSPIIMYVARFGFLPWLILFSWEWLNNPRPKKLAQLGVLSVLACPAFLTATVFFVWLIILTITALWHGHWKAKFVLIGFVLLLNAFWLMPFSWYTITKSALIPKSGTFVAINELLLNAPFERFELTKLFTFTGDFGSGIHFTDPQKLPVAQHPWFSQTPLSALPSWYYFTSWGVLLIGLLGLVIFTRHRRTTLGWWLFSLFVGSTLLLTKEYSPLGIVFNVLSKTIPFLQVVLRFGGTKLNPPLILVGSILCGVAMLWVQTTIAQWQSKLLRWFVAPILTLFLCGLIGWMGIAPLSGNFTAKIMRVKLPSAYLDLAHEINQDHAYGRVLHLPVGLYSYWRSYSWGYYGSSFLSFMVEKPLIEKTFSPGNLEHDYFEQALASLTVNAKAIDTQSLQVRARKLGVLLQKAGVRFVVADSSIQPEITAKQLVSWEVHPQIETELLLQAAVQHGILTKQRSVLIDQNDPTLGQLTLYTLNHQFEAFTSPTTAIGIDSQLSNTFIDPLLDESTTTIQGGQLPYRTYPWWQPNYTYVPQQASFTLQTAQPSVPTTLVLPAPAQDPTAYLAFDLFLAHTNNQLVLSTRISEPKQELSPTKPTPIYTTSYPKVAALNQAWQNPTRFLNNWHSITQETVAPFRLAISDQVLPIPQALTTSPTYIGTVLLSRQNLPSVSISLLLPDTTGPAILDPILLSPTDNPNCRFDGTSQHQAKLTVHQDSLVADTNQGSFCFGTKIDLRDLKKAVSTQTDYRNYFEVAFTARSETTITASTAATLFPLSRQLAVAELAEESAPLATSHICLSSNSAASCLNQNPYFTPTVQPTEYIASTSRLFEEPELSIIFQAITGHNAQSLRLEKLQLLRFAPMSTQFANFTSLVPPTERRFGLADGQISFPYPQSQSASYPSQATGMRIQSPTFCIQDPHQSRPTAQQYFSSIQDDLLIYSDTCSVTLDTTLPYYSANAYFWTTNYQLLTGNQPKLVVQQPLQLYNQLFSQSTNYPVIPGSKPLEPSTSLAGNEILKSQLLDALSNPIYATTSAVLAPLGTTHEPTTQSFAVNLQSTNQSLLRLAVPTIFAFPSEWQQSYLESAPSTHSLSPLQITAIRRLAPSLWSVQIFNQVSTADTASLLTFDQAYDQGWILLTHTLKPVQATHLKVDGWKNGWLIESQQRSQLGKLYVFYLPELLSMSGWFITLITLSLAIIKTVRSQTKTRPMGVGRAESLTQRLRQTLVPKTK